MGTLFTFLDAYGITDKVVSFHVYGNLSTKLSHNRSHSTCH
jgi:hypothetical protein